MTGMVSHPVVGVISDSSALSNYCVFGLASFDDFVTPIETSIRVNLIESLLGNRGVSEWVLLFESIELSYRSSAVVSEFNFYSQISCDRSSSRYCSHVRY